MVDTCIFNWLLDGDILPAQLPTGAKYFITQIQHDELSDVKAAERKKALFAELRQLKPASALTASSVIGVSKVGAGKISDGAGYDALLDALNRKKKKKNNLKDALIGETVLKNGYTLVSADGAFCDVMVASGAPVIRYKKSPTKRHRQFGPSVLMSELKRRRKDL